MHLPQQFRALLGSSRTYRAHRTPRSMALYFIACALAMALVILTGPDEC
jgi:hypothetical protein